MVHVVYISRVLKCDATVLVFGSEWFPTVEKIWIPDDLLHNFAPFSDTAQQFLSHNVRIAIPSNHRAKELFLAGDDFSAQMESYVSLAATILSRSRVLSYAELAEYPLE